MGMDPFIGEITLFAGNYAPYGYAFCDGSILSIAQNQALFCILGTTYGGDGRVTFALPDLRGRVPVGAGQSQGTSRRELGDMFGSEQAGLHTGFVVNDAQGADVTTTKTLAVVPQQGQPEPSVPTVPPATTLNYIIAIYGIFPSRW